MQFKTPSSFLPYLLIPLMACELVVIYTGSAIASMLVCALVLLLPIVSLKYLRVREFYVLSASIILAILLFYYNDAPGELIEKGLNRAGFLASFIMLMGVLRNAAITSPAILECGNYVTKQPPQRRFLGVMFGSHIFSSLLNLGALSLMVPIVQRGIRYGKDPNAPLDEIALVRERRQITAILRGFAWFLIWAPTAVTQAVLPTLLTDVDVIKLMTTGLCVALAMMALAWVEDLVRWGPLRRRLIASGNYPHQPVPDFPGTYFRDLVIVFLVLIALGALLKYLGSVSFISGIMLAAPAVLVGWVYVQADGDKFRAKKEQVQSRVQHLVMFELPAGIREVVSFATAGFIGTVAAYLLPTDYFMAALSMDVAPGWVILLELTLAVWVAGQIGLSPVTMAVFLGSAVAELPAMPVDVTYVALAIACGSSVSTLGAPFSAGILMLSRVSGYETTRLSWGWNTGYTLAVICVLAVIYAFLTGGS